MVKSNNNNRIVAFFQWLWFEYLIFTALYMLGTRERIAFTSCLVAFLATATYSSYVFLPHYIRTLVYYLGGWQNLETEHSEL